MKKKTKIVTHKFQIIAALKIMIIVFSKQLTGHWPKIAKIVRDLALKPTRGTALWNFVDFVTTLDTPLTLMITPLVQHKVKQRTVYIMFIRGVFLMSYWW